MATADPMTLNSLQPSLIPSQFPALHDSPTAESPSSIQTMSRDIQPPTAPRSMRRNISPPPVRRADPWRSSERDTNYGGYDSARRESRRSVSDCYTPSSPRHHDHERGGDGRTSAGPRREKQDNPKQNSLTRHSTGAETLPGARVAQEQEVAAKVNSSSGTGGDAPRAREFNQQTEDPGKGQSVRQPETRRSSLYGNLSWHLPMKRKAVAEAVNGSSQATPRIASPGTIGQWKSVNGLTAGRTVQVGQEAGTRLAAPSSPLHRSPATATPASPPAASAVASSSLIVDTASRLPTPANLDPPSQTQTPLDTDAISIPNIESVGRDALNERQESTMSLLKPPQETPAVGSSRLSTNEETASVSSANTSRNKSLCRSCMKPGRSVTPLVPCTKCGRGYHDRCGDPCPSKSEHHDRFVCGKCLKKQQEPAQETNNRASGRSSCSPAGKPVIDAPTNKNSPDPLPRPQSSMARQEVNGTLDQPPPPAKTLVTEKNQPGSPLLAKNSDTEKNQLVHPQPAKTPSTEKTQLGHPQAATTPRTEKTQLGHPQPAKTPSTEKAQPDQPQPAKASGIEKVNPGRLVTQPVTATARETVLSTANSPPRPGSSPQTAPQRPAQGDLYKGITCPKWKRECCYLLEAHCLFAHRDTGRNAPYGEEPAKSFTCPQWRAGVCRKTQCPFSHHDTGLHVGSNGEASTKHITCYAWKSGARCNKEDEDCLFAHRNTPYLAWQPLEASKNYIGRNSLKRYVCPRLQAQSYCRWSRSDCPYNHPASGISLIDNAETIARLRRLGQGINGQVSPRAQGLSALSTPAWAESARKAPFVLNHLSMSRLMYNPRPTPLTTTPPTTVPGTTQDLARKVLGEAGTPIGQADHAPSNPVRRMARRSAISVDPRLLRNQAAAAKISSTGSSNSGKLMDESARPPSGGPPQPTAMGAAIDASSAATAGAAPPASRKHCEICGRAIFGAIRCCVKCTLSGQPQKLSEAPAQTPNANGTTRTVEKPDKPGSPKPDFIAPSAPPRTATPSLQQYLVANQLKRSAPEDTMFVSRKKSKAGPEAGRWSVDEASRSLRQEAPRHGLPVNGASENLDLQRNRRPSLEDLARMAVVEKQAHLVANTSPKNGTMPTNGSIIAFNSQRASVSSNSALRPDSTPRLPNYVPGHSGRDLYGGFVGSKANNSASASTAGIETPRPEQTARPIPQNQPASPAVQRHAHVDNLVGGSATGSFQFRCIACLKAHKRCLHASDESLDPRKCRSFVQDYKGVRRPNISIARWNDILEAAGLGAVEYSLDSSSGGTTTSSRQAVTNRKEDKEKESSWNFTQSGANRSDDRNLDESEDDVPLMQSRTRSSARLRMTTRSSTQTKEVASSNASITPTEAIGVASRPEDVRSGLEMLKDQVAQARSLLLGVRGKQSTASEHQSQHPEPILTNASRSTPVKGKRDPWTSEDEARAIAKLRERGVRFEPESASDGDFDGEDEHLPPRRRIDPLWKPQQSFDLYEIDSSLDMTDDNNLRAAAGAYTQPKTDRPSKKQLMGNLLLYQCRDRKRRFGDPHQEVQRNVVDMEVSVLVEQSMRLDTPDPWAMPRIENKVSMSFREFAGVPQEPVIAQGTKKDELVFHEGKKANGPTTRSRRIPEEEKFPFVYGR